MAIPLWNDLENNTGHVFLIKKQSSVSAERHSAMVSVKLCWEDILWLFIHLFIFWSPQCLNLAHWWKYMWMNHWFNCHWASFFTSVLVSAKHDNLSCCCTTKHLGYFTIWHLRTENPFSTLQDNNYCDFLSKSSLSCGVLFVPAC